MRYDARMSRQSSRRMAIAGLAIALLAGVPPTLAQAESFSVESAAPGDWNVSAKGASVVDLLTELGEQAGFEVEIDPTIERPPVWATIHAASVEDAVRRILRRRSYALRFDGDGRLSRVLVLKPADPTAAEKRRLAQQVNAASQRRQARLLEYQRRQNARGLEAQATAGRRLSR
jgi:hypothetical protein